MSRRQKGLEILVNNAALLMCFLLVIYNALFSRNFLNLNTAWNIPVSYTHLDVYKRQKQ